MSSIYSSNSEADSSELLENIEDAPVLHMLQLTAMITVKAVLKVK